MKKILKIGLLLIAFSSYTISAQNAKPVTKKITTQKAKQTTKNESFYVDVRTPTEFAQGSVKGAINIPLDQIENQLAKFKGKKKHCCLLPKWQQKQSSQSYFRTKRHYKCNQWWQLGRCKCKIEKVKIKYYPKIVPFETD